MAATIYYSYCSSGGTADELVGLSCGKGENQPQYCFAPGIYIAYLPSNVFSSSQHIPMVGLYTSLSPLTYKAPVRIKFCCNQDGWTPPPHPSFLLAPHLPHPTTPLQPLLLLPPKGPDPAPLALRPFQGVRPRGGGGSTSPTIHRDVCTCASC